MIDKVKIKDPLLEAQIDELDNYIEKHYLRHKIGKLVYGEVKYTWKNVGKHKDLSKQKEQMEQLCELTRIRDKQKIHKAT